MLGRAGSWVGSSGGGGSTDTTLRNKNATTTRFAIISSGTSGTVALPSNATVILDDFGGTVDAVVTQATGGKPLQSHALTSTGSVVATTFDASGNWAFSAAPVAYPVAIVYRVYQTLINYTPLDADVWGDNVVDTAATANIGITIDGGGAVISTGVKGFIYIPYDCVIQGAFLMADISGSIVIDVWKVAFGSFPPTVANTIVAAAPPTLSSARSSSDTTLTGWTKNVLAGDVIAFNVNSATTVTRVNLLLKVTK